MANRARSFRLACGLAALVALAACSSRREPPPKPAPTPVASPSPALPAPPPRVADWRDAPITPGIWRWSMEGSRSVARFGNDALVLSCDPAARTVSLIRPGAATGDVAITLITASATRTLTAAAVSASSSAIVLALQASDPLLDAMAFSRGRFAVETAGLPTLYVPSWPEVSRVIEDCR
jgi:hypothetical protein